MTDRTGPSFSEGAAASCDEVLLAGPLVFQPVGWVQAVSCTTRTKEDPS